MAQEMLEKNGFVGSGIICLNAQILSKSSSIRFEKRTLGGTRKGAVFTAPFLFESRSAAFKPPCGICRRLRRLLCYRGHSPLRPLVPSERPADAGFSSYIRDSRTELSFRINMACVRSTPALNKPSDSPCVKI